MRSLDRLSHERLPRALGKRDLWTPRVAEIARISGALADSAEQVPTAADTRGLTPAERREFLGYAAEVERRARELSRDAKSLSPHELDQRLVQLEEACDSCHERFRIPAGGEKAAP
jgi:cytochrome c556